MKKIIIIGGGIGGLSAGIYARRAGYETEIYEKNPAAGGQCMGWSRKGHHIDNCIHWLAGTKKGSALRKLWEDLGALSEDSGFVENDKFYTSCLGQESITLWRDLDRTQREMLALSPADEAETRKFITHVKYALSCQMPVDKPMDMMNVMNYIKLGKDMASLPKVMKEYGKINLYDVAERFRSPLLKKMLTDYLPGDFIASSYIISYATMASGNGEIPAGGSLAMANRIVQKYKELGGALFCNRSVKRVMISGESAQGVELEDGAKAGADYVICAADTMELFGKLIGKQYMDEKWKAVYADENSYPVFTAFQLAFSIDKSAYGNTGTEFFECEPFDINGKRIERMSVRSYEYEPGFAPEGKTVLQSNFVQFDEDYRYWKSLGRKEYEARKQELAKAVQDRILDKFPALRGHMELLDCWTPLTYERYCNAYHGAYMSFITKKDAAAFQVKGIVKGLSNLYIAGQWIQAPGGLPVAAASGKFAVQRIEKSEGKKISL